MVMGLSRTGAIASISAVALSEQAMVRQVQPAAFTAMSKEAIATPVSSVTVSPAVRAIASTRSQSFDRMNSGGAVVRDWRSSWHTHPRSVGQLSPGVRVRDMRLVKPELAKLISDVRVPIDGTPRDQITVPISPVAEITDQVVFEAATNAAQTFILPCYRLAVQGQQYQIALEQQGTDWSLTLYLEKHPHPQIEQAARGAADLDHAITITLTHNLMMGNAVVGKKDLVFQEIFSEGNGVRAVLRGDTLPERDQLYYALTDPKYEAVLVVRRAIAVAIPVPQYPVVVSNTSTIRGTWTFSFDTGIEGGNGDVWWQQQTSTERSMVARGQAQIAFMGMVNFDAISPEQLQALSYSNAPIDGSINSNRLVNGAVFAVRTNSGNYAKVQVQDYGYNLTVRWVTYSHSATTGNTGLFREVTRALDNTLAPQPFVFPLALHGYIFQGISDVSGKTSDLTPIRVNSHNYYQDRKKPNRFFILPDAFKLARRPEPPYPPLMSVEVTSPSGSLNDTQYTIKYVALPFVNPERLKAATAELLKAVPESMRSQGIEFDHLDVDPKKLGLRVAIPGVGGSSGPYQPREQAFVDLKAGIHDVLTLTLDQFQAFFDGLFGGFTTLFGQVTVDLGDNSTGASIPFIARMDDLLGELFHYDEAVDDATGGIKATLQNAIESPLTIHRLTADLVRGAARVAGQLQSFSVPLPLTLQPGESVSFVVAPLEAIAGSEPLDAVFDISGIVVQPNQEKLWDAIIDPFAQREYVRTVEVKTPASTFKPSDNLVEAIVVDFERGETVELTAATPAASVKVRSPLREFILSRYQQPDEGGDKGSYRYQVQVIPSSAGKPGLDGWQTSSKSLLYLEVR